MTPNFCSSIFDPRATPIPKHRLEEEARVRIPSALVEWNASGIRIRTVDFHGGFPDLVAFSEETQLHILIVKVF